MGNLLNKLFSFLKYFLLIVAFGLVFFGIMKTYDRLDKSLIEAVDVFIPFAFVLVMYMINLGFKNKYISQNLFFNFVSVLVFLVIILIGLRSLFDTNMILWYRYNIDFNPAYFADNISLIQILLYMLGGANVVLLICGIIDRDKKKKVNNDKKESVKEKDNQSKQKEVLDDNESKDE